jgi:hypothetical protein
MWHMSKARPHLAKFGRTWPGSTAHSQARPQHNRPHLARIGRSWPRVGSTAPIGAPVHLGALAPTICQVSSPRHQQSHKHTLDGWDTPVNGWFDQKAKVGSTWINGPTLNRHNHHSEATLGFPEDRRCITRQAGGPTAPIHLRAGWNRPKEPTYNRLRSSDQGHPRWVAVDHRVGCTSWSGRTCHIGPTRSTDTPCL